MAGMRMTTTTFGLRRTPRFVDQSAVGGTSGLDHFLKTEAHLVKIVTILTALGVEFKTSACDERLLIKTAYD